MRNILGFMKKTSLKRDVESKLIFWKLVELIDWLVTSRLVETR
jgi:hypothetical protein